MADTPRPLPPGLLPSDEWLIQMVREGRVDADIGGELGLSAGEVRDRIALVASKLDVDGRVGIQRYFGIEQGPGTNGVPGRSAGQLRPPRRLLWLAAAVVALGGVAAVATVALTQDSGSSQTAIAAAASVTASAENPGGWFDAGPLLFVDGTTQPVLATSVRAGFTAVTMAGPGLVEFNAGNVKWISGSKNPLGMPIVGVATGTVNGEQLGLRIQAGHNTTLIADSSATIRFFGINGLAHPILLVTTGKPTTVGNDGRLFIDHVPLDPEAVLNADTGEQLNVSKAQRLSPEGSGFAVTRCGGAISNDDGGHCYVAWFGGEADGYQISDHGTAFRITATTADGKTPLSVAIGEDGTMYVGLIHITVGCPCDQALP